MVFTDYPKKSFGRLDIEEDHRICGSIIDGDDALLMAAWLPQPNRPILEFVEKTLGPGILVDL